MAHELNAYLPIGMLESLVMTIAYRPCYTNDREASFFEMPEPTTILVADFFLERFLESNALEILGMEEYINYSDESEGMFYCEELTDVLKPQRGWCPYIVNVMYVDMMGKVSVPDLSETTSPFPSAKRI